ncbi:hypothetical protein INT45_011467 [Circinella minor]|uniref:MULE transposase domain-containing protein n=1 Tax=Circinella minor TaxID=1195481 RepID=A0A8H7RLG9_9FUNG|nr:hypothetical protein INT45_011467 [Circinella minor]
MLETQESENQPHRRQRKQTVVWTRYYRCHRATIREQNDNNNSEDEEEELYDDDEIKTHPVQKKTKQAKCLASLKVTCYMDDINNVVISYLHEHSGHTPRSIEDVQFLPKSDKLNERILEELRKGYNVRSVREYLQCEYDSLPITNRDSYVNTVDVYNIFYKYREERCAKDTVDFASDQFSFGFSAPWQKELLLSTAGKFISSDATHDVSQYSDGVMYTMVIRHPIVGRGIPVAYLITNNLSSTPLVGWFYSLASLGLTPQRITIDHDFAEDNALTTVWPGCTTQHYVWHVQRAWMINIKSKVVASVGRTTG